MTPIKAALGTKPVGIVKMQSKMIKLYISHLPKNRKKLTVMDGEEVVIEIEFPEKAIIHRAIELCNEYDAVPDSMSFIGYP
jgi:hypothetical protein